MVTLEEKLDKLLKEIESLKRELRMVEDSIAFVASAPGVAPSFKYYEERLLHIWNVLSEILYKIDKGKVSDEIIVSFYELKEELLLLHKVLRKSYLSKRVARMLEEVKATEKKLKK